MADDIDREAFEAMIEVADPFDVRGGVTSWDVGTDPRKELKKFEDLIIQAFKRKEYEEDIWN